MARVVAYGLGVVYLGVGVVGFAVTGFERWLEAETGTFLLWFRLNPTHNLAHLAIGGLLLWAGTEDRTTSSVSLLAVGLLYLVLGAAGFAVTERPEWNILALNTADHLLHLATGTLLVVTGLTSSARS